MIVRGVNVFPTQIEELLLRVPGLAPHFQCVLSRPARLDELTVRVEARPDAAAGGTARAALADRLGTDVKQRLGVTVQVEVVDPGTLARSLGKARRIVDRRPKG